MITERGNAVRDAVPARAATAHVRDAAVGSAEHAAQNDGSPETGRALRSAHMRLLPLQDLSSRSAEKVWTRQFGLDSSESDGPDADIDELCAGTTSLLDHPASVDRSALSRPSITSTPAP
jgi:hypothetical protein